MKYEEKKLSEDLEHDIIKNHREDLEYNEFPITEPLLLDMCRWFKIDKFPKKFELIWMDHK